MNPAVTGQPSPTAHQQRADELFGQALDRPPAERQAFLRKHCGADDGLRHWVEELLRGAAVDDSLLRSGGALDEGFWQTLATTDGLEERVVLEGRYRVVRELGRGGMGVVYLAERADGQFEQQVALKVIRQGASRRAAARFRRERQILADLTHPHIARLLDGGVSSQGQPYLVMEHVEGRPIDRYCRDNDLDLKRRLELLCDVCEAVQAAHRQLVVHRDLKPSNILVNDAGEVKLLDFGIAKLVSEASEEAHGLTQTDGQVMTPQYGSPEQFRGDPITVASDIYQLGLIGYELLSGRRPYDLCDGPPIQAMHRVCVKVPPAPSDVAANAPSLSPARRLDWRRRLKGDLDAIVLKALHKDPERRYRSVDHLRDDLQRHLRGQPVSARPDRFGYRLGKFLQRHRWATASTLVSLGVVLASTVAFTVGLAQERDRTRGQAVVAEEQRQQAEEVVHFLVDLFESANPRQMGGTAPTVREVLDKGAARVDAELADQPMTRARLSYTIGKIYDVLGNYPQAKELLRTSLELRRAEPAGREMAISESLEGLASVAMGQGKPEEARRLFEEALEMRTAALGVDDPRLSPLYHGIGVSHQHQGQWRDAEILARRTVELAEGGGVSGTKLALYLDGWASTLDGLGRVEEARQAYRRVLAMEAPELGPWHPARGVTLSNLAITYALAEDFDAAMPLFRDALEIQIKAFGEEHHDSAVMANNLATAYMELERFDEAEDIFLRTLDFRRRVLGEHHPDTGRSWVDLGHNSASRGNHGLAEERLRQGLEILDGAMGLDHPFRGLTLALLGTSLAPQGKHEEAKEVLRESLAVLQAAQGREHYLTSVPHLELGRLHLQLQELDEAEELLLEAVTIRRTAEGVGRRDLQEAEDLYAQLQEAKG